MYFFSTFLILFYTFSFTKFTFWILFWYFFFTFTYFFILFCKQKGTPNTFLLFNFNKNHNNLNVEFQTKKNIKGVSKVYSSESNNDDSELSEAIISLKRLQMKENQKLKKLLSKI